MINQNYILIVKFIDDCGLVVRIANVILSRVSPNIKSFKVSILQEHKHKIF
jgi:hypothetical protein